MSAEVRSVPTRVKTSVEMFSDVIICRGDECRVVQVIHRWWLYDDGSYSMSVHRADDPMRGTSLMGSDPGGRQLLETRTSSMWQFGQKVSV